MEKEEKKLRYGEDDGFDPHDHREDINRISNLAVLTHILKAAIGTGILALPEALKNAGYVSGVFIIILMGFLCTYCIHILVQAQYVLCKRHKIAHYTFSQSMRVGLSEGPARLRFLAPVLEFMVEFCLFMNQFGIGIVYNTFIASNIKKVVDEYFKIIDVRIYIAIQFIPLFLLCCIQTYKILAPFSLFANLLTLIAIIWMMYYVLEDLPSISTIEPFAPFTTSPLAFGTVVFSYGAIGVIMSLEAKMKKPKDFGGYFGVLNIGLSIVTFLYASVGFLGYLKYNVGTQSSLSLNIPQTVIGAQIVKLSLAMAIIISYALQAFVAFETIWNRVVPGKLKQESKAFYTQIGLRFIFVIATTLIAIAVPLLGLFISLIGAAFLTFLALIFPPMLEFCVRWPDDFGKYKLHMFKDICLLLFGTIGCCIGSYCCLRDIIRSFQK